MSARKIPGREAKAIVTHTIAADDLRFDVSVGFPMCCVHCGHQVQPDAEPRAGAILIVPTFNSPRPRIGDPAFQAERDRREAAALAGWYASPAGKAWERLKAKPSKKAYLALLAAHREWEAGAK